MVRAVGKAALAAVLVLTLAPTAAHASTVCIPLLAGTQCVQFLEGRPDKPGLSKGMKMRIVPKVLADGKDLTATIRGFQPGEGLRRFNYNIFGPDRMNEYSGEFRRADAQGRFTWVVSPSTALYKPEWGKPALCVYGQRSKRLACASFGVAASATATTQQSGGSEQTQQQSGGSQQSGGAAGSNCVDAGFSIICSG